MKKLIVIGVFGVIVVVAILTKTFVFHRIANYTVEVKRGTKMLPIKLGEPICYEFPAPKNKMRLLACYLKSSGWSKAPVLKKAEIVCGTLIISENIETQEMIDQNGNKVYLVFSGKNYTDVKTIKVWIISNYNESATIELCFD